MEKVVIIGGGPAGLTAAIYTARASLSPLVIEGYLPGGQLMNTTLVENFPGWPEGIYGQELMKRMRAQAERLGARFITEDAEEVRLMPRGHVVRCPSGEFKAHAVIIATGAVPRRLGVAGETELSGKGVSWCATCDGFFFKQKDVAVIGGGDSAMEEAIYLASICRSVKVIHRRAKFRASAAMQEKARKMTNIEFLLEYLPKEFVASSAGDLCAVKIAHVQTGEERIVAVNGAFIAIGHLPQTALFKGQIEMDDEGYIVTQRGSSRTSMEGVFCAGDVRDREYKQAITAAGSGCMAALDAISYLQGYSESGPLCPSSSMRRTS